jgi:hypothetical protein
MMGWARPVKGRFIGPLAGTLLPETVTAPPRGLRKHSGACGNANAVMRMLCVFAQIMTANRPAVRTSRINVA